MLGSLRFGARAPQTALSMLKQMNTIRCAPRFLAKPQQSPITQSIRQFKTMPKTSPMARSILPTRLSTFRQNLATTFARTRTYHQNYNQYQQQGYQSLEDAYFQTLEKRAQNFRHLIWIILLLNTAVFASWVTAKFQRNNKALTVLVDNFILSGRNIVSGRWWTTVTSAFSHMNLQHFGFNMWGLWIFAGILGTVPGVRAMHLGALTIGSAIAGSVATLWHSPNQQRASLGASGVVMGLMAAATCLFPMAQMSLLLIPVRIPMFVMSGLYVAADLFYLEDGSSNVGHAAHLGGAAFGVAFYTLVLSRFGGVFGFLGRSRHMVRRY